MKNNKVNILIDNLLANIFYEKIFAGERDFFWSLKNIF